MLRIAVCLALGLTLACGSVRPGGIGCPGSGPPPSAAASCPMAASITVIGVAASHAGFLRDLDPLMSVYSTFGGVQVAAQGNTKDGVDYLRVWLPCPGQGEPEKVSARMLGDPHFRTVDSYPGNCFLLAAGMVDCQKQP